MVVVGVDRWIKQTWPLSPQGFSLHKSFPPSWTLPLFISSFNLLLELWLLIATYHVKFGLGFRSPSGDIAQAGVMWNCCGPISSYNSFKVTVHQSFSKGIKMFISFEPIILTQGIYPKEIIQSKKHVHRDLHCGITY